MLQQELPKKKGFVNIQQFSNHDINKFVSLLQKGIYRYEHINDWEKCNEIFLPEKKDFYSHVNMEDINDVDYAHTNVFVKILK